MNMTDPGHIHRKFYGIVLVIAMLSSPTALDAEPSLEPGHIQADPWNITAGATLKTTLEDWGRIANPSWSVIWEHSSDYRIRTSVTFYGSFEDVTGRLVDVIHDRHPELSVTLYRGNQVIHVADTQ